MLINKMGQDHKLYGINNQDGAFRGSDYSIVMDGCSDTLYPEVGIQLLINYFRHSFTGTVPVGDFVSRAFEDIISFLFKKKSPHEFSREDQDVLKNYMSFTILIAREKLDDIEVYYCGDGFIITIDKEGKTDFHELSDQHQVIDGYEYPRYFVYQYLPEVKNLFPNIDFQKMNFSKGQFTHVGIATDGLKYILKSDDSESKSIFLQLFERREELKVKRFINAHPEIFKDDISIVL